jgi:ATP-dependent Lhr-like helicase
VAAVSSELLAEVLSQEKIPTIVTRAIVEQAEARWQNRAPEFQAANVEDLFAIIAKLAPISENDLAERSKADPKLWLQQLKLEKRILLKKGEPAGWMPAEDSGLFEEPTTKEKIRERIRRCLRIHGPLTVEQIEQKLNLAAELIQPALRELAVEKEVVRGQLVVEIESEQWCDRHNFAELYRRAITVRRQITAPASREQFYRFLLRWHQVAMPGQSLIELVKRYAGFRFPISVFEREILRSRWCSQNIETLPEVMNEFFELIARGEVIPTAVREGEEARIGLTFMQRGSGHVFTRNSEKLEVAQHLEKPTQTVFDFLKENGASLARDIVAGTAFAPARVRDALSTLARSGLASCENYGAFLSTLQEDSASPGSEETGSWLPAPPPAWTRHGRNRSRQAIRNRVQQNVQLSDSRWFLSTSFAVMGKELTDNERAERQARLLLARYGILAKEWYRREQGLLPWYQLFQMLKRLEWQGEVRRGYFIEGLSGVQFALSDAVELLEKIQTQKQEAVSQPVLISAVDPALPLGGTVDWDLHDMHGNKVTVVRSPSNHFVFIDEKPIFYSENYGSRVWRLAKIPDDALDECAKLFKTWLQLPAHLRPRKRIEIIQINDQPAATCKLAEVFVYNGFERDGDKLVLWPSGV